MGSIENSSDYDLSVEKHALYTWTVMVENKIFENLNTDSE